MSVGIMFIVFEAYLVLRYQFLQVAEHIALYVRIRVFVYCQPAGRVLREQDADAVNFTGSSERSLYFVGDVDHLFTLRRTYAYGMHKDIADSIAKRLREAGI